MPKIKYDKIALTSKIVNALSIWSSLNPHAFNCCVTIYFIVSAQKQVNEAIWSSVNEHKKIIHSVLCGLDIICELIGLKTPLVKGLDSVFFEKLTSSQRYRN